MENFILLFNNLLSADYCEQLINKFHTDPQRHVGRTGSGVDLNKKNSTDLSITNYPSWSVEEGTINHALQQALRHYIRTYPHMLIGAVAPSYLVPGESTPRGIRADEIGSLSDEALDAVINSVFEMDMINLQHYPQTTGGYPHWHSEQFPDPNREDNASLHRVLLWLIYLNDVAEGGETEFLYQRAAIQPKVGSLVLAPCGFTHTHCGKSPLSSDKYVLTGWVKYRQREELYGLKHSGKQQTKEQA